MLLLAKKSSLGETTRKKIRRVVSASAAIVVLCVAETSSAFEYLGVQFSQSVLASLYDSNSLVDAKSPTSSYAFSDHRYKAIAAEVTQTGVHGLTAHAKSTSVVAYRTSPDHSGSASFGQTASLNGYPVQDNPLELGQVRGYVGIVPFQLGETGHQFQGDAIQIPFRVDESDGDVVFHSQVASSNSLSTAFYPGGAGEVFVTNASNSNIVFRYDGDRLAAGKWLLVMYKPGFASSTTNDAQHARSTFAASWTFSGVFPGQTPASPLKKPDFDIFENGIEDDENEAAEMAQEVTGAFLTSFPATGGLGTSDDAFVGFQPVIPQGTYAGAWATGYKIASEESPITSFIMPAMIAGAEDLTIEFDGHVQGVVAGERIDFGAAGVQSFTLAGFDPTGGVLPSDALVMGLKFADEGFTSLIATPNLYHPPGDYNENGFVDAADYVLWRDNPSGFPADSYATWRSHFGEPLVTGSGANGSASAAIPEPATAVMLMIAAAGLCISRRRAD